MRNIYKLLVAVLSLVAVSCSDADMEHISSESSTSATIIGKEMGAIKGELMVKFRKNAVIAVKTENLKSVSPFTTGNMTLDVKLSAAQTTALEPVFPVDVRFEERSAEAGLNRWHVVKFDREIAPVDMAHKLAAMPEVEKVQYVHRLERRNKPAVRTIHNGVLMRKAAYYGSASAGGGFNDPGLPLQWGFVNRGDLLGGGVTVNKHGDVIAQAVQGVDVGCEEAWKICVGDPSIIVAVMDEGVMFNHPDLKANMWVNEGEIFGSEKDNDGNGFAGDRYGYNFVTNRGIITYSDAEDTGHGTHIAGTIAAVNNNGEGVSGIAGGDGTPDSGVKIMSIQVFANGNGVSMYQEARAVKYAADNGAVVLQCSWGYNSGLSNMLDFTPGYLSADEWAKDAPLEKEALDYFVNNAGSPNGVIDGGIVVFAAGNESAAMAGFPGGHPDYISVAAIAADGTPSNFSNFGVGVRISAPGGDGDYHKAVEGNIYSTLPPYDGSYYGYMEGTSMACPHVSGVVALGLSYASKLNKHFSASEFRSLVLNSVSDATVESYFTAPKTYYVNYESFGMTSAKQMLPSAYKGNMGTGIVNAHKLLKAVEGAGIELRVPNMLVTVDGTSKINFARFFKDGGKQTYTVTLTDGSVATFSSADQVNFLLKGLKAGSSKATVKASNGVQQEFFVTVRKSSGWL